MRRRGKASARSAAAAETAANRPTAPDRSAPSVATRLDNLLHIGKGRLRHAEDPLGVGKSPPQFSQSHRRSGTVDQLAAEYRFTCRRALLSAGWHRQPTGGIGKWRSWAGDEILKLFKRARAAAGSFIIGFATVVLHNPSYRVINLFIWANVCCAPEYPHYPCAGVVMSSNARPPSRRAGRAR